MSKMILLRLELLRMIAYMHRTLAGNGNGRLSLQMVFSIVALIAEPNASFILRFKVEEVQCYSFVCAIYAPIRQSPKPC